MRLNAGALRSKALVFCNPQVAEKVPDKSATPTIFITTTQPSAGLPTELLPGWPLGYLTNMFPNWFHKDLTCMCIYIYI